MLTKINQMKPLCKCGGELTIRKSCYCYDCGKFVPLFNLWCLECRSMNCGKMRHKKFSCKQNGIQHFHRINYYLTCEYCKFSKEIDEKSQCLECGVILKEKIQKNGLTQNCCPCCEDEAYLLLQESGIPIAYQDRRLNDFSTKRFNPLLINRFKKIIAAPKISDKWVVVYGRMQTGKTSIACAFGMELIEQTYPVKYININDYLGQIRLYLYDYKSPKGFATKGDYESIMRCKTLIIDDVWKLEYKPFEKNHIYQLINFRHSNNLFTLICTQLDGEEMAKAIGSQTVIRILERSGDWFDIRGKTFPK